MVNSIMTAKLIEAQGLPLSDSGYVVIMETEGQRSISETSISPTGQPLWNEILTFDITTGIDPINIEIQDGRRNYLCSGQYFLDDLKDQGKHEEIVPLVNLQRRDDNL
jgi:hypothetical protein